MDILQRTSSTLTSAEQALADLASEAAKESNYDAATCLIDSARDIKILAARTLRRLRGEDAQPGVDVDRTPKLPDSATSSAKRGKAQKTKYPRFLRQDDQFVKVGWSRSERTEYEQDRKSV